LGIIVADTQRHADEAAKAVRVTYKEQKPPILTIDEAIATKSFFDPQAKTLTKGDADSKYLSSLLIFWFLLKVDKTLNFHTCHYFL